MHGTPTVLVDGKPLAATLDPRRPGRPAREASRPAERPCHGTSRRMTLDGVHRRPAQGRAARPPRRLGLAADRLASSPTRHPGAGAERPRASCGEFFAFRDFAHFVEVYLAVVDLIRTPEDIRLPHLRGRPRDGDGPAGPVRRADLHAVHLGAAARRGAGIPIEAYTEAIEDARVAAERDFGLVLRWIYDIPGESGLPAADATLDFALDHRPDALVGFGLGGPEIGVPRPQFQPHFDAGPGGRAAQRAARRRDHRAGDGLGRAARCSAPSGSGTARRRRRTPTLLAHLAETGIPLEVCPSSNIATRAVATLDEHPIRAFRDAGVTVTVNSDDPPMFGTTPQPGVRDRRRPARPRRGRAWPTWPAPPCARRSLDDAGEARGCSARSTPTRVPERPRERHRPSGLILRWADSFVRHRDPPTRVRHAVPGPRIRDSTNAAKGGRAQPVTRPRPRSYCGSIGHGHEDGAMSTTAAEQAAQETDEGVVHILWMNGGLSCDGDSVALTAATQPSIEEIVLGALPGLPEDRGALAADRLRVRPRAGRRQLHRVVAQGRPRRARAVRARRRGLDPQRGDQGRGLLVRRSATTPRPASRCTTSRVARPAGAEGDRRDRGRHLRDVRRHPRHGRQPHRRDGRARLPRLGLEVQGRAADRLRARAARSTPTTSPRPSSTCSTRWPARRR